MSDTWDGRPVNPDQRGWHWLKTPHHGPDLCLWSEHGGYAGNWRWHYEGGHVISSAAIEVCEYRYLGPALEPAQVTRLVEALEGYLHFDDAFINHGPLGHALRGWRAEAQSALASIGRKPGETA